VTPGDDASRDDVTDRVREVVGVVCSELRAGAVGPEVRIDSELDRELGLDSLSTVEVLSRLEQRFSVTLPEDALARAATVADLVELVDQASGRSARTPLLRTTPPLERISGPVPRADTATTLGEVLEAYVRADPDRVHLRAVGAGHDEPMTYGELRAQAGEMAAGLAARGVRPGDRVALMLPTQPDYFTMFFGVLLAGATPVPIYPPTRRSQIEDHLRRHAAILDNAGVVMLVTVPEARRLGSALRANVPSMRFVTCPADIAVAGAPAPRPSVAGADLALIQYTSGSTGMPKGVALTHGNLLANIRAMGSAAAVTEDDVFVSWLPLYHDMGLIGAWLGSLCLGIPLVVMAPTAFLTSPARWLRTISEVGGTISASPNFGYEMCVAKIADDQLEGVDLSSWRLAFNGAEAVRPETIERFASRFATHGFRPEAMTPVYGLAESSVGLAFPPLGRGPLVDRIDRDTFLSTGNAAPARTDDSTPLRFVACGRALVGHDIAVVDSHGRRVGDRIEGRIRFRGPSATTGYFRAPEATAAVILDGWVDTGDLGYLVDGELYVTGRVKDLVIRAGRNLHPEELEAAVAEIPGVRRGRVAVFGSTEGSSGTERLVVVAETDETDSASRSAIREAILGAAVDLLGTPPDEVVLAPRGTLLKTSSGKLRRSASRDAVEQGIRGESRRPVWWQVAHVRLGGRWVPLRASWRRLVERRGAWRAWAALALIGPPAWITVVALPRASWRWAATRHIGRVLARLAGVSLTIEHLERLPAEGPVVIVANHTGFVDAMVLFLMLPGTLHFVAASELSRHAPLRILLHRLGVLSVDRDDRERGVEATAAMVELGRAGERLVVFPEGRLSVTPGLRNFHLGAFIVAAAVGCPVVPLVIHGSRAVLAPGTWQVRPGPVGVEVAEPIAATNGGWQEAVRLRDQARQSILSRCGEPDSVAPAWDERP